MTSPTPLDTRHEFKHDGGSYRMADVTALEEAGL